MAQIWGCREADDRRGDTAAFAVDPAAVIQLKVQVGTTGQTKAQRKRGKDYLQTKHTVNHGTRVLNSLIKSNQFLKAHTLKYT